MTEQDLRISPKLARFAPSPQPAPSGRGRSVAEGEGVQISDNHVSPMR